MIHRLNCSNFEHGDARDCDLDIIMSVTDKHIALERARLGKNA